MINLSISLKDLEYFLCIMVRVTGFIATVPFFGMNNNIPRRVRVALGFFISILLYQVTLPHEELIYTTVFQYAAIVLKEAVVGILIGLSANICTMIVTFAGRMVDMDMGLSMASLMDPMTRENVTLTGMLYQYGTMLIMIVSGVYQYVIKALAETFTLIPINKAVFHTEQLLTGMITFLGEYIVIGFRIGLPVFAAMLLLNAILGILAKIAPQLNMFSVGIQLKIMLGFFVLLITIGMLPNVSQFIYMEMKKMVATFVKAMI